MLMTAILLRVPRHPCHSRCSWASVELRGYYRKPWGCTHSHPLPPDRLAQNLQFMWKTCKEMNFTLFFFYGERRKVSPLGFFIFETVEGLEQHVRKNYTSLLQQPFHILWELHIHVGKQPSRNQMTAQFSWKSGSQSSCQNGMTALWNTVTVQKAVLSENFLKWKFCFSPPSSSLLTPPSSLPPSYLPSFPSLLFKASG